MGDKIFFNYDGKQVAEYQFVEWSMDAKSPMDWFKGCVCFEVTIKGLDPTKVEITFEKNTDPDIFKKMFNLQTSFGYLGFFPYLCSDKQLNTTKL